MSSGKPSAPKADSEEVGFADSGVQAQKSLEFKARMQQARAWLRIPDPPAANQMTSHIEEKDIETSSPPVARSTRPPPMSEAQLANYFTEESGLLGALQIPSLGMTVLEAIFESGFHNVKKLGTTSLKTLCAMHNMVVSGAMLLIMGSN